MEEDGKAALEQVRLKERDSGASEEQIAKRCGTNVRLEPGADHHCHLTAESNGFGCRTPCSQVPPQYTSTAAVWDSSSPVHSRGSLLRPPGSATHVGPQSADALLRGPLPQCTASSGRPWPRVVEVIVLFKDCA
jgi:hypothetical protein